MFVVTDNADELLAEAAQFDAELHAGLAALTEETCQEAAAHARSVGQFQDHTGDLRKSIVGFLVQKTDTGATGQVASVMPYSSFVEGGTRPHDIRPKEGEGFVGPLQAGQSRRKKGDIGTHRAALRWQGPGGVRFAALVHHPGSRAYPFFGPAYLKVQSLLPAKGSALLAKLISKYSG